MLAVPRLEICTMQINIILYPNTTVQSNMSNPITIHRATIDVEPKIGTAEENLIILPKNNIIRSI